MSMLFRARSLAHSTPRLQACCLGILSDDQAFAIQTLAATKPDKLNAEEQQLFIAILPEAIKESDLDTLNKIVQYANTEFNHIIFRNARCLALLANHDNTVITEHEVGELLDVATHASDLELLATLTSPQLQTKTQQHLQKQAADNNYQLLYKIFIILHSTDMANKSTALCNWLDADTILALYELDHNIIDIMLAQPCYQLHNQAINNFITKNRRILLNSPKHLAHVLTNPEMRAAFCNGIEHQDIFHLLQQENIAITQLINQHANELSLKNFTVQPLCRVMQLVNPLLVTTDATLPSLADITALTAFPYMHAIIEDLKNSSNPRLKPLQQLLAIQANPRTTKITLDSDHAHEQAVLLDLNNIVVGAKLHAAKRELPNANEEIIRSLSYLYFFLRKNQPAKAATHICDFLYLQLIFPDTDKVHLDPEYFDPRLLHLDEIRQTLIVMTNNTPEVIANYLSHICLTTSNQQTNTGLAALTSLLVLHTAGGDRLTNDDNVNLVKQLESLIQTEAYVVANNFIRERPTQPEDFASFIETILEIADFETLRFFLNCPIPDDESPWTVKLLRTVLIKYPQLINDVLLLPHLYQCLDNSSATSLINAAKIVMTTETLYETAPYAQGIGIHLKNKNKPSLKSIKATPKDQMLTPRRQPVSTTVSPELSRHLSPAVRQRLTEATYNTPHQSALLSPAIPDTPPAKVKPLPINTDVTDDEDISSGLHALTKEMCTLMQARTAASLFPLPTPDLDSDSDDDPTTNAIFSKLMNTPIKTNDSPPDPKSILMLDSPISLQPAAMAPPPIPDFGTPQSLSRFESDNPDLEEPKTPSKAKNKIPKPASVSMLDNLPSLGDLAIGPATMPPPSTSNLETPLSLSRFDADDSDSKTPCSPPLAPPAPVNFGTPPDLSQIDMGNSLPHASTPDNQQSDNPNIPPPPPPPPTSKAQQQKQQAPAAPSSTAALFQQIQAGTKLRSSTETTVQKKPPKQLTALEQKLEERREALNEESSVLSDDDSSAWFSRG